MADRFPDQSRVSTVAQVNVGVEVQNVTVNLGAVNPQLTHKDLVEVSNSLAGLSRYSPDYIRRSDTYLFTPDEFEE